MNATTHKHNECDANTTTGIPAVCLNSCRNLLQRIDQIKQDLFRQSSATLAENANVLRAALNEAEALAWQTPYPHLFFPDLAQEKAVAVRRWAEHQQVVRSSNRTLTIAA